MKIKNQFVISIVAFSVVLAIIAASIIVTEQQTAQLNGQTSIARDVQNRVSNLNYISNDYFLYQSNSDLDLWQAQLSAVLDDLAKLNTTSSQQTALANNVYTDLQNLNGAFQSAVTFLENAPRNESVRVLPAFQTEWSLLAVQNQALTFGSQQLSENLRSQVDQSNFNNIVLIVAFLGLFGAYFITNYVITYRRTLKSISDLQDGIGIVGSGNFDYSIKAGKKDEVSDISRAVNQMAANLKAVTASKADLEKEVEERKKAEKEIETKNSVQEGINSILESTLAASSEQELGQACLSVVERLTGSRFGFIGELNKNGLQDVAISDPGWEACSMSDQSGHRRPPGNFEIHGVYGRVISGGKGFFTNDPQSHPDRIGVPTGHPPLSSFLGVPLRSQDSIIGMIAVANREGGYAAVHLEMLEALAPSVVEAFLRKRAEDELRSSEENYRHLLEYAPTAIYEIDYKEPRFKSVNDAMCRLTGYSREELLRLNPISLLDSESAKRFRERIRAGLAGEKIDDSVEFKTIRKDGRELWVVLYVKPLYADGKLDSALVVGYDVTERKEVQEKIQQLLETVQRERDRLSSLVNSIPDEVWFADPNKRLMLANPLAVKEFGLDNLGTDSIEKITSTFEVYRADGSPRLVDEAPPLRALKGEVIRNEDEIVRTPASGELRHRQVNAVPVKDNEGNIIGSVSVVRDITELKRAEEKLEMQAELIDLDPNAIMVRKLDGSITYWSRGAENLYGYSAQEAVGQNMHDLLRTRFPAGVELYNLTEQTKTPQGWSGELVQLTKEGRAVVVQSRWVSRINRNNEIEFLESNVDVTERNLLQQRLEEKASEVEEYATRMEELAEERALKLKDSERLATIGATAGMVGHDIRNPLQAITSDVYLAKSELALTTDSEEKKNALESLDEIEKNVDYINKIVQDLQDFARPLNPKPEESDLKMIIGKLIAKNGLPKNVKARVKVADDARKIIADSYYLNRILYNLVTNSVQAMPNGGRLTIEANKEDDDIVIAVGDTGVGIPKEVQAKMFTVMFTTKSKGQGFGLPVVKRMTESLGGSVTFDSQVGRGTIFKLRLPFRKNNR